MKPMLIIVSAPSGAGKTTLCDMLLQEYPELCYSISCTTREPRGEEEDGEDYHFMTLDNFKRLIEESAFLEYAYVHGNAYGTLEAPVRQAIGQGMSVLMDIDVEGADQVRRRIDALPPEDPLCSNYIDIFVAPPSMEELRRRLHSRGEDDARTISKRIENAEEEMARSDEFAYNVVNKDLAEAYEKLSAIIEMVGAVDGPQKVGAAL